MVRKDCSVIILAAGNSSRMGQPKFTLTMPDGSTFLDTIIKQYSEFGCTEVVVVLNNEGINLIKKHPQNFPAYIKIVINPHPEFGRFFSIKTGLKVIPNNYVFIHNVDNPHAKKAVLNKIYNSKTEADVIKPVVNNKGGHPVLISRNVIDYILKEKKHDINFKEVLMMFSVRNVEVGDETVQININTRPDYNRFLKTEIS